MDKTPKALAEVLQWKDKIYEERKHMTLAEWVKMLKENSRRIRAGQGKARRTL